MGWRYQVPFLLSLNLQVVVPDMLGYGQTSAPHSHEEYTLKKMTAHIAELVKQTTNQPIVLGGHDWGGAFVWSVFFLLTTSLFLFCIYIRVSERTRLTTKSTGASRNTSPS
jgi:pimeloyl-ACP methyl ester carboxylesterase